MLTKRHRVPRVVEWRLLEKAKRVRALIVGSNPIPVSKSNPLPFLCPILPLPLLMLLGFSALASFHSSDSFHPLCPHVFPLQT